MQTHSGTFILRLGNRLGMKKFVCLQIKQEYRATLVSQRKCKQNSKTCEPRISPGVLLSNIVVKFRNAHDKDHSVNFAVSCRSSVLVPAGVNMQNVRDGNWLGHFPAMPVLAWLMRPKSSIEPSDL